MRQTCPRLDGAIQAQPVISLQDGRPKSQDQVQGQSDRQPQCCERTRGELTHGNTGEADEAD